MTLTIARILRLVIAAFCIATILSLGTYFSLMARSNDNADLLAAVTELRGRASRIHLVLNRVRMEAHDVQYLRNTMPPIAEAIKALDGGGMAFGRRIVTAPREFSSLQRTIAERWRALEPGLAALAALTVPAQADAPPDTRLHPQINEYESVLTELVRLLETRQVRFRYQTFNVLIFFGGAGGALLALSAVLLNRRVIRPIALLRTGTQAIRGGDYRHRVPVRRADELGALGESFNEMAAVVQRSVEKLTRSVEELQAEVERRRAVEERLLRSEARLADAQRIAHIGNWEVDLATDNLYWSEEVYRIFGLDAGSGCEARSFFWSAVPPEDHERVCGAAQRALATREPYAIDHRIVRPDGATRMLREHAGVVCDETGRVVRMVGTVQDITEQQQIEEQLRQAQKMEAIGLLAGGVAHDFNNLLTVILGYCHEAQASLSEGSLVHGYQREIEQAAEQAASLTAQLLAFSRKQILQPRIVNLNVELLGSQEMLRRILREDIALDLSLSPALGQVRVDRVQLQQIVLNLVVNARDAMPDGGRLTIETQDAELDATHAVGGRQVVPGPYIVLSVSDTGIGMDEETKAHIFEPFFTTKGMGRGTGLGLASVYGIVRQSGGYVWVYSEPGHGTTMKIYFPRVDATPSLLEAAVAPKILPDPESAKRTILVVEDNGPLRALMVVVCKQSGYAVLEAENGKDAVALCEAHPHQIHLAVTDMVMPEMSGRSFVEKVRLLRPDMKVLYCSGYSESAIFNQGAMEPRHAFLPKPFTPESLIERVRSMLQQ